MPARTERANTGDAGGLTHRLVARIAPDLSWWVLGAFGLVIALHASGIVGPLAYPFVILGGVACGIVGLRRHRPEPAWPWWILIGIGFLWTIAGVLREATGATGDLTSSRSLLPDLFALPGYLAFGVALVGLLRTRTATADRDVILDGLVLAAGAALAVHELLVIPTLGISDGWVMAQLAVVIYPVASICLLIIAARLAFSGGERTPAFLLLLAGTAALVVGDIVFALGEVGHMSGASQNLLEVPYLLVPACIGCALLHPSSARFTTVREESPSDLSMARRWVVGVSLVAPVVVLLSEGITISRLISAAICVALAITAVARIVGLMRSQAEHQDELTRRATHDELTGLPSRQLLSHRADELINTPGRRAAMMFIDLDRFKLVNDSMGHAAGDELLVQAAERLRRVAPPPIMVGRVSGDEFLVLIPDCNTAGALSVAERIRSTLAERYVLPDGIAVFTSASIGIAVSGFDGTCDANTMIREADAAMYRSKETGRDAITVFDASMRERIERRVEIERTLRTAIERGEIGVAYQPVVSWPDGRVLGVEALARWTKGTERVAPTEFIDVAEESGLIIPLGAFVLDEALRQVAWMRANIPSAKDMYASVNVSPRQLQSDDFADIVAETLHRHHLPGGALFLEITESVMMGDTLAAASAMTALTSLDVRLSVDDFGTGFSSLSYLKRFPVDVVKIDRSFVSGLAHDESDASLVAAIIKMANALGLATIAEGVETHEQARRLIELGCTKMQGYLFSAPVPMGELVETVQAIGGRTTSFDRRRRCAPVR